MKQFLKRLLPLVILLVMVATNAFAAEKLIISQINQNEADVSVFAQLITVESNTIVNTTLSAEEFFLSINSGNSFSPEHMELFSNSGAGIAYTIVVDQNTKITNYNTPRSQCVKALQEFRNVFGEQDYVQLIYAGKAALPMFGSNNGGFITGDFSNYSRVIEEIRDDNATSKPVLYEGIKLAMDTFRSRPAGLPDRHVIIVLTNGRDYSTYGIEELMESDCGTPIYVIGIDGGDSNNADLSELGKLARKTGGQLFETTRYDAPVDAVIRLDTWLDNTYVLKFKPAYEYFGSSNTSWKLEIKSDSRSLNSEGYTASLAAIVTPEPTAEPTPEPTNTPEPTIAALEASPTPEVTATPAPTTMEKLKIFVTSPLGIGLIAAVVVVFAVIIVLVLRSTRVDTTIIEYGSDNVTEDDGDDPDGMGIHLPDDDEITLPKDQVDPGSTLPLDQFDPDKTLPQQVSAGITLRFIIDCDGVETTEVRTFNKQCVLGRKGYANDLGVSENRSVGRKHCKLTYSRTGLVVEDCGSMNGTMLNGTQLIAPSKIQHGDKLEFGDVKIKVEVVNR